MRVSKWLVWAWASVGVGAAAAGCGGEESHSCTLIGCASTVTILLAYSGSVEELRESTIELCKNEICVDGPISMAEAGLQTSLGQVQVSVSGDAGNLRLAIEYSTPNSDSLASGDHYEVTLRRANLQVTQTFEGNIGTYEVVRPNGPDCEPACKFAEFDTL